MAEVMIPGKECDRCKKIFPGETKLVPVKIIISRGDGPPKVRTLEVCSRCDKAIDGLIETRSLRVPSASPVAAPVKDAGSSVEMPGEGPGGR